MAVLPHKYTLSRWGALANFRGGGKSSDSSRRRGLGVRAYETKFTVIRWLGDNTLPETGERGKGEAGKAEPGNNAAGIGVCLGRTALYLPT